MARSDVQSELYTELGVYRSKVEGKRTIARKAGLLVVVSIEGWDRGDLSQRMAAIDGDRSSSNSLLIGALGLFPGWIGAAGKILGKAETVYESAQSMVEGSRGRDAGADDWEAQLRNDLELLQKKAETDPAFAELVDQYLGDKLGPINASADETLAMYPPFQDSRALVALRDLVTQDHATVEAVSQRIQKLQDDLEEARLNAEAEQRIKLTYEERMQEIAEQRIYCRLAVRVLHELNPEAARATGAILQGVMDAREVAAKLDLGLMTATAGTASYVLIAFAVIDALQGGGQDEAMQARLDQIVQLIVDLSRNLTARLEQLQATADLILKVSALNLQQAVENKELLVDLHKKADEIHAQIFEQGVEEYRMLNAGFDRPLLEAIGRAFSHKETHKPGTFKLSIEDFNECLSAFATAATKFARDGLALPPETASLAESDLLEGLTKRPLAANLPYLARAVAAYGGVPVSAPQINFDLWQRSTIAIVDLIADWPEHQKVLEPRFLDAYINDAADFQRFFDSMQDTLTGSSLDRLARLQTTFANQVLTALNEHVLKSISDVIARSMQFDPVSYSSGDLSGLAGPQLLSLFDRLKTLVKMTVEVDPPLGVDSIEMPEEFMKLLTSEIKAGLCFGLVRSIDCHFKVEYKRRADFFHDRKVDVVFDVYWANEETPILSRRFSNSKMYGYFTLSGFRLTKLPFSKASIYAEISQILAGNPSYPYGSKPGAPETKEENASDAVSTYAPQITSVISNLVATASQSFISSNAIGSTAVRALLGLSELLNQYVTFGTWNSVQGSEKVSGLLFGGDSPVAIVSATPFFEKVSVDETKKVLETYPERLIGAMNEAVAANPPRPYSLKLTRQLKDLRAALAAGNRWSSDFAKRAALSADGDQLYYNAARSLSGSARSSQM